MTETPQQTPTAAPAQAGLWPAVAGGIRAVYQPIVDLASGTVVGYEALSRGPAGSPLEPPSALFAAAREQGLTGVLDRACLRAALRGAAAVALRAPAALFLNVEPDSLDSEIESAALATLRRLPVFFELTERSLTDRPAELLATVERMRAAGFGIALDDVGADRRSLALLPLLRPDVVKLDISLIHRHPSRRSGQVMNGVCAYAESTGAVILAEGIERERHLFAAAAMGATLGQGWHFGRPAPLPRTPPAAHPGTPTLGLSPRTVPHSMVSLVQGRRDLRIGPKDVLLSVTRALEHQALELGEHAVIVATFQHARFFTGRTRRRYEHLSERASLIVALGEGMPARPAAGVRGGPLAPDDPLVREWDLAVLGPHFAGAIVARDLGDRGPDRDRRFEFLLTFDRELVIEVAAGLLSRLTGAA